MKYFTEQEMCSVLGYSRTTMYFYRKRGMPYLRLGTRTVRYIPDDVIAWLSEEER